MMEKVEFTYLPKGVCAREFKFEMLGNTIKRITVTGGCPGNLLGIGILIEGKEASDVIADFAGVKCGDRKTSCPAQIALALEEYLNREQ